MKILISFLLLQMPLWAVTQLNGAGASFPYPIYSKWFSEYQNTQNKVRFNYRPIGSGGGVRQVIAETVDFGASDVPLKDKEKKKMKSPVLEIPMVIGAVVVVYNGDFGKNLLLDGPTLSDIYLGKITKWNDPKLVKLNPGANLPNTDIMVTRRADSSGTSAIFTNYLASQSDEWKSKVGAGKMVKWPAGLGGKGNDGVTGIVKNNLGAIGYVELAYALTNDLKYASLKNQQGKIVTPSIQNVSSSAYPISSMTYLLLPVTKTNQSQRTEIKKFIEWAYTNGDQAAKNLHYAPLSKDMKNKMRLELSKL